MNTKDTPIPKTDDLDVTQARSDFLKMQKKIVILKYSSASDSHTGDSAGCPTYADPKSDN